MKRLKFTVVPHPPYSPDFAPSEFWLFPKLKETLKGQHFLSDAKVEAAVGK
jgi:transposase